MKTAVSVAGKKSTPDAPLNVAATDSVDVTDHVSYRNFIPNEEYTFAGRLMEISNGTVKEVATAEVKQTLYSPTGTIEVTFKNVKLEAGKKYVAFETATSTKNLLDYGQKKYVIKHENPNDYAQTIIVKKPNNRSAKPPAPVNPPKPDKPEPNKPPAPINPPKPSEPGPSKPPTPNNPPNLSKTGVILDSTTSLMASLGLVVAGIAITGIKRKFNI